MIRGVEKEIVTLQVCSCQTGGADDESLPKIVYGVTVYDFQGKLIRQVNDLSTEREVIEEFVARCNSGQLHRIHVEDVLADFVESLYL